MIIMNYPIHGILHPCIFQISHRSRMPILFSKCICFLVPSTPICPGPFQNLKVAIHGNIGARICIPWALICSGPFQHFSKVAIIGSKSACPFIPWALIRPSLFQQLEVTIQGSIGACRFIPSSSIAGMNTHSSLFQVPSLFHAHLHIAYNLPVTYR